VDSAYPSYFISDVHLSDARPEITARFTTFFEQLFLAPKHPRNVFILGDLFDAWLGDDMNSPLIQAVTALFQRCRTENITLYFMAGNRDYLLGEQFSKKVGVKLLPDPIVSTICNHRILLTHGDQFMTLDKKYIWYRAIAQHNFIKSNFPKLPFWLRDYFAKFLRTRSKKQNSHKPRYIMDVNPVTVIEWLKFYQVPNLIHGHIHQMGVHDHLVGKRYVLGDWYKHGNYIKVDSEGIFLKSLEKPPGA
jgi:UDP-2,3-diacylglucosamine hydrolase